MDLGAYAQIEDLEKVAKANGIEVPRLRGYRLMSEEKPIDMDNWLDEVDVWCLVYLCEKQWNAKSHCYWVTKQTDKKKRYYIDGYETDGDWSIRWDRIHGKHRKMLKTAIHNAKKEYIRQAETFNKYVGRKDVLFIHSRIGGNNWFYYYKEVVNKPWFIERVDDAFDNTYCDIYARIKEDQ